MDGPDRSKSLLTDGDHLSDGLLSLARELLEESSVEDGGDGDWWDDEEHDGGQLGRDPEHGSDTDCGEAIVSSSSRVEEGGNCAHQWQ